MNHSNTGGPTGNEGYVYILTNPSFREDWVKIGLGLLQQRVTEHE